MRFHAIEIVILGIIAVLALSAVLLFAGRDIPIDYPRYALTVLTGLSMLALGQVYRRRGRSEGIALAATAAGLFILFSIAGSVFNYGLLPLARPPIDRQLAVLDGLLGFDWPGFVTAVSAMPVVPDLLRMVYASSMPQLVVLVLVLGFTGRAAALHRFLLTGVYGALLSIGHWWFRPSYGASSIFGLPAEVLERMPIAVGPDYGAELVRIATYGPDELSPVHVLGLIGFPSFHMVMAAMALWFSLGDRRMAAIFVPLNLVMIPAILVQGGHHLADVIGGAGVFVAALVMARATAEIVDRDRRALAAE